MIMRKVRRALAVVATLLAVVPVCGQDGLKKVYDESRDPLSQIDSAVVRARLAQKFVVCQVGGNWCPWCLRFADFVARDSAVGRLVAENFEYIHVNYDPRRTGDGEESRRASALMRRLDNCGRFGFPVFVVLDGDGRVLHIQDSSFLEEGRGYDRQRVLRFFRNWTPSAVGGRESGAE